MVEVQFITKLTDDVSKSMTSSAKVSDFPQAYTTIVGITYRAFVSRKEDAEPGEIVSKHGHKLEDIPHNHWDGHKGRRRGSIFIDTPTQL